MRQSDVIKEMEDEDSDDDGQGLKGQIDNYF